MFFKFIIVIIFLVIPFYNVGNTDIKDLSYDYVGAEIAFAFDVIETKLGPYTGNNLVADASSVIKTYSGPMTAYGPDCVGCSGVTASGYNVLNGNIYYKDETFGNIRILAADKSLPFGSIVRISGLQDYPGDLLAIVLDRGSAIGFNKHSYFDLLYKSERETLTFGCQNATYEILRIGY